MHQENEIILLLLSNVEILHPLQVQEDIKNLEIYHPVIKCILYFIYQCCLAWQCLFSSFKTSLSVVLPKPSHTGYFLFPFCLSLAQSTSLPAGFRAPAVTTAFFRKCSFLPYLEILKWRGFIWSKPMVHIASPTHDELVLHCMLVFFFMF